VGSQSRRGFVTTKRLVTDAEAANFREVLKSDLNDGYWTDHDVTVLLDTRKELITVLEQIEFASTDALSRRRASEVLAQVRGE
jgi:hypothetical protein